MTIIPLDKYFLTQGLQVWRDNLIGVTDENKDITELVIPYGITRVTGFRELPKLRKVIAPASLKFVGTQAFWWCTALKEVILPSGLAEIGTCAFYHSGISSIRIPDGIKVIKPGAFGDCPNLKQILVSQHILDTLKVEYLLELMEKNAVLMKTDGNF